MSKHTPGYDFYTLAAAKHFKVAPENVTIRQRNAIKKANFARTYGGGRKTMKKILALPPDPQDPRTNDSGGYLL